jgi:hypothetical protein
MNEDIDYQIMDISERVDFPPMKKNRNKNAANQKCQNLWATQFPWVEMIHMNGGLDLFQPIICLAI